MKINAMYPDHLLFYRLCSHLAAAATILASLILTFTGLSHHHIPGGRWVIAAGLFGTCILLVGRLYLPRSCSLALLIKFHISNAYLAYAGLSTPPWIPCISSTFFVLGVVESIEYCRIKTGSVSLWLSKPGFAQVALILFFGVILAISSSDMLYSMW